MPPSDSTSLSVSVLVAIATAPLLPGIPVRALVLVLPRLARARPRRPAPLRQALPPRDPLREQAPPRPALLLPSAPPQAAPPPPVPRADGSARRSRRRARASVPQTARRSPSPGRRLHRRAARAGRPRAEASQAA